MKTQVVKFNDGVIRKAVESELQRGGQVFFVHNVIYNIGVVHEHLKKILPDVKIAVAHGKMNGKELERIMLDFIGGKYDLLLSTNIIESGLDISNVNTIFINNAHRFGLADLYQLRGRVGRSTKQGYAYLLVPKEEALPRDALVEAEDPGRDDRAGRGPEGGQLRPGDKGRRQPARQGAVGPYQPYRVRALLQDAGGGRQGA